MKKKILLFIIFILIIYLVYYNKILLNESYYTNNILYNTNILQEKTKLFGNMTDEMPLIIQRMTEPDIGFYPSKMKLFDYYDVIS